MAHVTPPLQVAFLILLSFCGEIHLWCCQGKSLCRDGGDFCHGPSVGLGERGCVRRGTLAHSAWGKHVYERVNLLLYNKEKRRHLLPWEGRKRRGRAGAVSFKVREGIEGCPISCMTSVAVRVWPFLVLSQCWMRAQRNKPPAIKPSKVWDFLAS